MDIFSFIPSHLYSTIYYYLMLVLCLVTALRYAGSNDTQILHAKQSFPMPALILCLLIVLWLGFRPATGSFGDTGYYKYTYDNVVGGQMVASLETEWLFNNIQVVFKQMGLQFGMFTLFVAAVYFGGMLFCCWKLYPNNTWIGFLFCLASFNTLAYCSNGMRNGMACSMILIAIALMTGGNVQKIIAAIMLVLALGIHKSTMLPAVALVTAVFVIKNPKYAVYIWLAAIPISLVAGNYMENFFAGLGFDDRLSNYLQGQENEELMEQFSNTGFRWDFLLYSAVPVYFTYYLTIKRQFQDRGFNIIATTYILANAFWIMVIRASFSNRFAYLSWFLYPIVICYPLLRFHIWDDQDKKTSYILLAYEAFTFTMFLLGR